MTTHKKRHLFVCLGLLLLLSSISFGMSTVTCEAASASYSKTVTPKTDSYVNIRKSYSTNSAKIGRLYRGSGASILKKGKVWLKIKSGSITGYVKKSCVLSGKKLVSYAETHNFPKKLKINVRSLIVREKASRNSDIVSGVSKNETYSIIRETKKWAKIKTPEGKGYVLKDYVTCSYSLKPAVKVSSSSSSNSGSNTGSSSSQSSVYSKTALCTVSSLRIRKAASTSSEILGHMDEQTSGTILKKGPEWTKIRSGSITGYIKNEYYVTGSAVITHAKKQHLSRIVSLNANMNVRASASIHSKRIGGAEEGSTFPLKQEMKEWVSIEYGEKTGYLKKDYVTLTFDFKEAVPSFSDDPDSSVSGATGAQVAAYALQFEGNPYVYGGTSLTHGCDCSGFTQSVYRHFGYSIPRISKDQANYGRSVSVNDLQKGDLVFYENKSGVIGHVALYIGDSRVISASNPERGIIVTSYNYRTPAKVRRVLR